MPEQALTPQALVMAVGWYGVFLFSTCLHEAAHAWAAWRLGDPTAWRGGQVTLNPWPHMRRSPFGMLVVPLVSFYSYGWMFGWASTPYDPRWAMERPRRAALMALAGPASNLALVVASGLALRLGLQAGWFRPLESLTLMPVVVAPPGSVAAAFASILSIFFVLNLILLAFNLMPVPPLDGSAALVLALPDRAIYPYLAFIHQPGLWIMGVVVAWNLFPRYFVPFAFLPTLRLLYAGL
jgi:Zn-dependent protease